MRRVNYSYDISKKLAQRKNLFKRAGKVKRNNEINKVERKLWKILGPSFDYTGNGKKKIGGKSPDFINESYKIIVELYGNYWHREEPIRKTLDRINLFKQYGYRTIIVWEDEVNPITVRRKLAAL